MYKKLSIIGVGNMAKAVIYGIAKSNINISEMIAYDKNQEQYSKISEQCKNIVFASSIKEAIDSADIVLLSVKPQNYDEVLSEIRQSTDHAKKLYISIAAGITSTSVSARLGGACVIRVLPNLPMVIGQGVSVICENPKANINDFKFVCEIFNCAGSVLLISEEEMNRTIGVTSSSPAYVFKFIDSIYKGAIEQGLNSNDLIDSICDMVIGAAQLIKNSENTPQELIDRVASKGGTTERALRVLDECEFELTIKKAMMACTKRADELSSL